VTKPSVGDRETMKSRLLTEQCATCIFRAGDPMHLAPGRLKDIVGQALRREGFIVCHATLRGVAPRGTKPAICRGFFDRYSTQALQVIGRLWGFLLVAPPEGHRALSGESPGQSGTVRDNPGEPGGRPDNRADRRQKRSPAGMKHARPGFKIENGAEGAGTD
jgi:hypothetical protein